jgi:hypothetical protein
MDEGRLPKNTGIYWKASSLEVANYNGDTRV